MSKERKTRVRRTKKSRVNRRTKRTKRTRRTRRMRGGMEGAAGGRPKRKGGKIPEDLKSYLVVVDGEKSSDIQDKITTLNQVLKSDQFGKRTLNLSPANKTVITEAITKLKIAQKAAIKREVEAQGKQMTQDMTAESMMLSPTSSLGSEVSMSSLPGYEDY